ncbi:hypothetical protein ACOSQ3_007642 [Xanthoceras sorbifolium]
MSSTQRSESMNVYFDRYIHSRSTLKEFVEQYEIALRAKIDKEIQADYRTMNTVTKCFTDFQFEKQFQDAYTIEMFDVVQKELARMMFCDVSGDVEELSKDV